MFISNPRAPKPWSHRKLKEVAGQAGQEGHPWAFGGIQGSEELHQEEPVAASVCRFPLIPAASQARSTTLYYAQRC